MPRGIPGSAGGTSIPQSEGKHPAEFTQALFAPFFIGMDDDFSVGTRAKHMTARFESATQFLVVIDLPVEDNRDVACFVEYGLAPSGKVNDAETAHSKRHSGS